MQVIWLQSRRFFARQERSAENSRKEHFQLRGPKWPRKHSPGLPWVIPPQPISPEGATGYGEKLAPNLELDLVRSPSPFRAKRLFQLSQGKPWAKLSCPCGAGPSGNGTGAKYTPGSQPGFSPGTLNGTNGTQAGSLC
jgi:hypothetical protein